MGPDDFAEAAGVSRETLAKLVEYAAILEKWQAHKNLVGASTLPDLWNRHFLDSAQLFPLIPGRGPCVLYDLGTGAGFPGLVLAIMAEGGGRKFETHLVESDRGKAAFLAEVCRATGLARRVTIHATRIANLPRDRLPKATVIAARALAALDELLGLAQPLTGPDTVLLFPKGAAVERELTLAGKHWKMRIERFPSRSDKSGTILRISDLARA